MRIDAHQHFWRFQAVRDTWITYEMRVLRRDFLPDDVSPELSRHRFDGSIAVQADSSEQETEFLIALASRHEWIHSVVGWVDLCASNVAARLDSLAKYEKLCGFRHIVQAEQDDRFLLRPDFLRGISALKQFAFTYDILIYPRQLPAAAEFVEQFPEQPFILDHLAKPAVRTGEIHPWSAHIRRLACSPNVLCKVSGLVTEAVWQDWRLDDFRRYLDVAFDAFGPRRLLFGSDWPVCLLAGTYDQVVKLVEGYACQFSAEDQAAIFGENAARIYGARTITSGSRTHK